MAQSIPRSMWSGVISWGMVTIPIKMGKATHDEAATMHQVHIKDGGRIRMKRTCEIDGQEVRWAEVGKGAELADGSTILLSDDDLQNLPLPTLKTAEVLYFCDASEIDDIAHENSYFLWPDDGGAKAYKLLLGALEESGKVAVCRIAIRSRESLAMVRAHNGALTLETLYWPAEIRTSDFVADMLAGAELSDAERELAAVLIESGTRKFDPDEHHDRYSEAVRALVDGRAGLKPAEGSDVPAVLDLQATLELAVAKAKEKRLAA